MAVTLSIVAVGFALFRFIAGYFPIFEEVSHDESAQLEAAKEEDAVPVG